MANQTGRTGRNRRARDDERRLKYAFDAGFLSCAPHPHDTDSGDYTDSPPSESSESTDGESTRLTGLAASLRMLSDALLRTERAEAELARTREALRLQSESRRLESEAELTRLVTATELQIASLVSRRSPSRKRKRLGVGEDVTATTTTTEQVSLREGSLLLTLLQYNLLF